MTGRHPFQELTKDLAPDRRRRIDAIKRDLLKRMDACLYPTMVATTGARMSASEGGQEGYVGEGGYPSGRMPKARVAAPVRNRTAETEVEVLMGWLCRSQRTQAGPPPTSRCLGRARLRRRPVPARGG